ncbi:hypothetical protein K458DRAFT_408210 [Lentithecium fluviatile CBS 122367]|uniref:CPAF-like PDZ domain-containing protein n=1 Tax=Lentithecium fluviatile CBS 122367 TaxID=1168545 RepID=A0A6G1IM80_9PLEO|nr:hypothetical protein K458DRAFT_408210 [Lentithecium fluviatile CBS 122367]
MLVQKAAVLCFAGCSLARSLSLPEKLAPRQDPTPTAGAPAALSTACGDIIADVDDPSGYRNFWAKDAYSCLQSVPFNPAVASRFLRYWNETIQFQSTLAYLKSPPQGYQQPAVDVQEELAEIQRRIGSGFYSNQYAFEADFQLLTYALHDGHVQLKAGAMSAFSWGAPFEIASASVDGKEPPKIFFTADIIDSQNEGWTPSAIKTINGEDVVGYLKKFAALNAWGYVEPHTEWNALMSSPALDVQSGQTVWSGAATFYPGDNLTVHFENYTDGDDSTWWDTIWVATYNEIANYTGPLSTGGDFYNYFVLGETPASFDPARIVRPIFHGVAGEPDAAPGNWSAASFGAFPENPDVAQFDLGPTTPGIVSGYFYRDISTGVLSLPSFDAMVDSVGNFSTAIGEFIDGASAAGLDNVIIDLQRNSGGLTLLSYTTFKYFFPDLAPFGGSRRRITPLANTLGKATTDFWELLDETDPDELAFKQEMGADDWLITNRLNAATGSNFSSWEEYATVVNDNDDTFSQIEQYDLGNIIFDQAAFNQWVPMMYVEEEEGDRTNRPWNPEQITILTDGTCGSACALFVEMMTRVGVKTVAAGGLPQSGPMQAASGNRGATVYGVDELDEDMQFAREIDEFLDDNVNASVPEIRESGMYLLYATLNLRDQVRKDDPIPLQFKYEAADCRIYYTLANAYNFTRLWYDVAAAAADPSLCVEGSTGFSTTNNTISSPPPAAEAERPTLTQDNPVVEQVQFEADPDSGLRDVKGTEPARTVYQFGFCTTRAVEGDACDDGLGTGVCALIKYTCTTSTGKTNVSRLTCLPPCECGGQLCSCPQKGTCAIARGTGPENKDTGIRNFSGQNLETATSQGTCIPPAKFGCPTSAKPKPKTRTRGGTAGI